MATGESPETDQARYAEPPRQGDVSAAVYRTWPHGAPALRIGTLHETPEPNVQSPEPIAATRSSVSRRAPWYLRLLRLSVGLTLLVLAWCGVLVITLLGDSALSPARPNHVARDTVLAVLKLGGACWVGLSVLAAIIAGAFSLLLALTNRDWR